MSTTRFSYPVAVRLNGAGAGTASVGPLSAREVWHVQTVSVAVASAVSEATCTVYVGDAPDARNLVQATFTGSSGDVTGQAAGDVKVGDKVWAVWTGGDPLVMATMVVTGTKDI